MYQGVGRTDWSIQWIYQTKNSGTPECKVVDVYVTYTAKVILPRWTDPQDGTYAMIWGWESYMQQIALHEGHHVKILLDNSDSVRQAIEASTCNTASAAGDNAIEKIKKMEEEYDKETDYGNKP